MRKFSFPPIANSDARILILGTMPGEKSLRLNQYYGHAGNHFWKLMFSIYDQPFTADYEARRNILLTNRIALWDVLKACEREGSADSAIIEEESNDFESFFSRHRHIKQIAFNGKEAYRYFQLFCQIKPVVDMVILPSTSSANTWKTFEEKLGEWKQIVLK